MKNQQHNATILKALRYEQKSKQSYLKTNLSRQEKIRGQANETFWDNSIKATQDRLEELAEAIEYMESLPIYLGGTSNKGAANNEK